VLETLCIHRFTGVSNTFNLSITSGKRDISISVKQPLTQYAGPKRYCVLKIPVGRGSLIYNFPKGGTLNKQTASHTHMLILILLLLAFAGQESLIAQTDRGIELYNSWQYQEAEKVLRAALAADPGDSRALYYLGLCVLLEEKHQEALDLFSRLQNQTGKVPAPGASNIPDRFQILIAMARAHLGLKQHAEAWKNLEAAGKENPAAADVYVYRGVYYLQKEQPRQALKELERAIKLDGNNAYAHYYAGHAYLRLGHPSRAVDMFKTFLQLAPHAPEAPKASALISALC